MSIPLRTLLVAVAVASALGAIFFGLFGHALWRFASSGIALGSSARPEDPVVRVSLSNVPDGAIPTFVAERGDVRVTRFGVTREGDSYVVPLPGAGEWTVTAGVAISAGKTRSASRSVTGGESIALDLTDDFPWPWVLFFSMLASLGVAVLAGGLLLVRSLRSREPRDAMRIGTTLP